LPNKLCLGLNFKKARLLKFQGRLHCVNFSVKLSDFLVIAKCGMTMQEQQKCNPNSPHVRK
jgi:hypothetical protein